MESVMLTSDQLKNAPPKRTRKGEKAPTLLGDLIDFNKLERLVINNDRSKSPDVLKQIKKPYDPLGYLDTNIKDINEKNLTTLTVPPNGAEFGIMKNWYWYSGYIDKLNSFGMESRFFVNKTFLRGPCMVVKSDLLVKMNEWYREVERAFPLKNLKVRAYTPLDNRFVPSYTNCCVGINWTIAEFVAQASGGCVHKNPWFHLISLTGIFEPAHHIFSRIPGTDYVMVPLQPSKLFETSTKWYMDLYQWGILYDSKVVVEGAV